MKQVVLEAEPRSATGKGAARKLRASGRIPGICYSAKSDPVPLSVRASDLEKILKEAKGGTEIIKLSVKDNSKAVEKMTLIKEVQMDPVQQTLLHVDFWEVDMEKEMEVEVPIKLVGKPVGVAAGGMLEQIRREITIACRPSNLVESIAVDVSGLEIGDALHVFDIDPGEGRRIVADTNFTIATVVAPAGPAVEEVEEEEVVEEEEEAKEKKGGEKEEFASS